LRHGLPGLSGCEVAKRIARDVNGAKIVLAALTRYGGEEDRKQSRAAGFDYHLVKSVDGDALCRLLRSWFCSCRRTRRIASLINIAEPAAQRTAAGAGKPLPR
jgi:CheY-like chemotaxis protein